MLLAETALGQECERIWGTDVKGAGWSRSSTLAAIALLALCLPAASAPRGAAPDRDPPSVTLDGLFGRVALSGLFADGKTWADATPVRSPAEIRSAYRAADPRTRNALKAFVDAQFVAPPERPKTAVPPRGLRLRAHIAYLWPMLTRRTLEVPRWSSLIPLPNAYVVPGGRFREIYYWDSYFTMLGFGPGQASLRRGMVDNFAYLIRTFGHVPNGNRTYYLSRSQPPFFFKMVELTNPAHPRLADQRYLKELRLEYRWWMRGEADATPGHPVSRVVRMPDGSALNRYWDDRHSPRDESYAPDVKLGARTADPNVTYRNIRAAAESGWDFSSRWLADGDSLSTIRTSDIVPPDLNSLLYGLETAIARGCSEAGDQVCASAMAAKAAARSAAIRKYLWNPGTGVFDDYDWRSGRPVGNISAAALYPLFAEIATRRQADRTAATTARELLREGGLVATNRSTGQQWDSPNGWAPLQWIAVSGLCEYGEDTLAQTIAQRWLNTVSRVYSETGKLLEKYDVTRRRPGGGGEYPLQDGFGWTNGVTDAMLRAGPEHVCRAMRPTPDG